jgi:Mn-dependent DtxR family transcriptional regulator
MKLFACATVTCCVSFEIQELPDVIRVVVLLNLAKGNKIQKTMLKRRLDKVCASYTCIEMDELEKALKEMASEGLILQHDGEVQLTKQGKKMSKE